MRALSSAGMLPGNLVRACENRNVAAVDKLLTREKLSDEPDRDAAIRVLLADLAEEWREDKAAATA